jgi:hypothetical protein
LELHQQYLRWVRIYAKQGVSYAGLLSSLVDLAAIATKLNTTRAWTEPEQHWNANIQPTPIQLNPTQSIIPTVVKAQ